jgi:hypothetical protein
MYQLQEEKIRHAIAEFDAGRLGAMEDVGSCCVYERDERHCIAGSMFSRESLDKIHEECLNDSTSVEELVNLFDVESECGFNSDSRKDEAIYKQCLEIGLKLRLMVGDVKLKELREAAQDY